MPACREGTGQLPCRHQQTSNRRQNERDKRGRGVGGWGCGGRNKDTVREMGGGYFLFILFIFLRGTQQGHLPGAIWWLRRFYTVVFVCLFRLGLFPGSASGRPSVIIRLSSHLALLFYQPPPSLPLRIPVIVLLLSQKSAAACHRD